uniref:von Hippel-Lindau disease tumour suppressor beta domain-containing protein n=1 Tax=Vespula pensylvanica TaxID=30213 RepID=A0A834PF08_VESPE|nr:hypothetical protein H0235_000850 [Vespula pensylvanica]
MAENEVPFLRSLDNNQISFVRFTNCTTRNVALYWIDYQGQAINYGTLYPGSYVDIDTFVTHPWIFVDDETKERIILERANVLQVFGEPERRIFSRAMVGKIFELKDAEQVYKLDIPRSLQYELATRLPSKNNNQEDS